MKMDKQKSMIKMIQ